MRSGFWAVLVVALCSSGSFGPRNAPIGRVARAGELGMPFEVAVPAVQEYTEREMIEYRHRTNMPRHWRYIMVAH